MGGGCPLIREAVARELSGSTLSPNLAGFTRGGEEFNRHLG